MKVWWIVFLTLVSGSDFWVASQSFMSIFMRARLALIFLKLSPLESMSLFRTSTLTTSGWFDRNLLTLLVCRFVFVDLLLSLFTHTSVVRFALSQPLLHILRLAQEFLDHLPIRILFQIVINEPCLKVNRDILLLGNLQELRKTVQHVFLYNYFNQKL